MTTNDPDQPHPSGQPAPSQQQIKRTHRNNRLVFGTGITLVTLLLVGAFAAVLVLRSAHPLVHASGGAPTPTPTPPTSTPTPGGPQLHGSLYTATPDGLSRIDLKSGKTLWTLQASSPIAPLVKGDTLFFESGDSANPFLEAVNAQTGTRIWSSQRYPNGFLLAAGDQLYDSFCNPSAASDPCHLDGINAHTGAQLWSYDLPQGNAWIALQHGVLYGVSYTQYFALNALTGAQIWHQDLLRYTDQEANMTPVVSGNVLSFASCNTTKQSSGFAGCYLYAFNASTGQELWHMPTSETLEATPTIMDGVVYAGAISGTLYAVKEQDGTQLWSTNAGGTIGQVLASAGVVYVETIGADGQTFHIVAFDAATHTSRWGLASSRDQQPGATTLLAEHPALSAGPASHPFVFEQGLIYIEGTPAIITVLNATDGNQVMQYNVPGNALFGFTVAM